MGKELGKRWAAKADWRGEEKRCFGGVGRLGEFLVWGRFGGSKSPLRQLSIGLERLVGLALLLNWLPRISANTI